MLFQIILTIHLIACIVWVGSVFMGTFVDWPAARASRPNGKFPFNFIVGQGATVFKFVYGGIVILLVSGFALVYLKPPQTDWQYTLLYIKMIALAIMAGMTLHGTFDTWPKLQFSTDEEAFGHYRFYMNKAKVTFISGLIAAILGLWMGF